MKAKNKRSLGGWGGTFSPLCTCVLTASLKRFDCITPHAAFPNLLDRALPLARSSMLSIILRITLITFIFFPVSHS